MHGAAWGYMGLTSVHSHTCHPPLSTPCPPTHSPAPPPAHTLRPPPPLQGTLTHMAPELLLHGRMSKAADVYAYGITLWELYTAENAFAGV